GAAFTDALEAVLPAAFATARLAAAVAGLAAGVRAAAVVRAAVALGAPPVSGFGLAFAGALPAAALAVAFGRLVREEALEVSFFVATDLPLGRTGPAPMAGLEFVCPSMLPPGLARVGLRRGAQSAWNERRRSETSKVRPREGAR